MEPDAEGADIFGHGTSRVLSFRCFGLRCPRGVELFYMLEFRVALGADVTSSSLQLILTSIGDRNGLPPTKLLRTSQRLKITGADKDAWKVKFQTKK